MKIVLSIVALLITVLAVEAPYPKQSATVLKSPRHAGEMVNMQMVVTMAVDSIPDTLMWEYDLPLPRDVTFVVHRAMSPHGPWTKFSETNQPPVRVIPDGFYRVETRNL